jgi:hypothetical protein
VSGYVDLGYHLASAHTQCNIALALASNAVVVVVVVHFFS